MNNEKLEVVLHEVGSIHCTYCKDPIKEEEWLCHCGAVMHHQCHHELKRCTTLGCSANIAPEERAERDPFISVTERPEKGRLGMVLSRAPLWQYALFSVIGGLLVGLSMWFAFKNAGKPLSLGLSLFLGAIGLPTLLGSIYLSTKVQKGMRSLRHRWGTSYYLLSTVLVTVAIGLSTENPKLTWFFFCLIFFMSLGEEEES